MSSLLSTSHHSTCSQLQCECGAGSGRASKPFRYSKGFVHGHDGLHGVHRIARNLLSFPFFSSLHDAAGVLAPLAYLLYWWVVPTVQLLFAMYVKCLSPRGQFSHSQLLIGSSLGGIRVVLKTQYLAILPLPCDAPQPVSSQNLHLVHDVYYRLYIPYAFGAIYNHSFEGFLPDTLGALLSESPAGLSVRQATLFFIITTCKPRHTPPDHRHQVNFFATVVYPLGRHYARHS